MATVLAVDDSATLRKMVSSTLTDSGHKVVQAADGETGLSAARQQNFDLVITDVNTPGMDGIALIRELRRLPGWRTTPLLILTTESADGWQQQGKSAGASGWLLKPVSRETLLDVVQQVLN